jgi:hypothetical protein
MIHNIIIINSTFIYILVSVLFYSIYLSIYLSIITQVHGPTGYLHFSKKSSEAEDQEEAAEGFFSFDSDISGTTTIHHEYDLDDDDGSDDDGSDDDDDDDDDGSDDDDDGSDDDDRDDDDRDDDSSDDDDRDYDNDNKL